MYNEEVKTLSAPNEIQKSEFIMAEKKIQQLLSNFKFQGIDLGNMLFKSKFFEQWIDKSETFIFTCMKENGLIDGQKLYDIAYNLKPEILGWINIPQDDFRIVDKIDEILNIIFGGKN